jgi:hypothetical protein
MPPTRQWGDAVTGSLLVLGIAFLGITCRSIH